jgi:hypothetical protein
MGKYPHFPPYFANQSQTNKMIWKPCYFDAFHTSNIESFGTRIKRSNTPEYMSLNPNKVYRTSISRTSLLLLNESQSLKFDLIQCVFKSRQDVTRKYPFFPALILQTKVKAYNSTQLNVFLRALKMWWETAPIFGHNFADLSYVQNYLKTGLIRCISHILYWTVFKKVQKFEKSLIHIVETKQVLSSE